MKLPKLTRPPYMPSTSTCLRKKTGKTVSFNACLHCYFNEARLFAIEINGTLSF
jgi:hypothetical protein